MATDFSFVEVEVPPRTLQVDASSVASRAAIGTPAVSSVGGGTRNTQLAWAELETPLVAGGVLASSVASRAAVGAPEVRQPVAAIGVGSRAAVGSPTLFVGSPVLAIGVASRAAVGVPSVVGDGVINGGGTVQAALDVTANPAGVVSRRAVGTPVVTSVVPPPVSEVTVNATSVGSRQAVGTPQAISGAVVNLQSYGTLSRAAVGMPLVTVGGLEATVQMIGVASRAAVGAARVTQIGQAPVEGAGGPDDDDEIGPHKAPKHMRAHAKKREQKKVEQAVEEATERAAPTKQITPETPAFRKVDGGILVTPEMLQAIKDEAMRAAQLKAEVRAMKESKIVAAAREIGEQKASARLARLADLAIQAAEEAEYEPAEREQVKTIELEDPVTGQPIKATITSKVPA